MANLQSSERNEETKRARGKNFTASDDLDICIAWLALSNDPLEGRDQQGDVLWKEIKKHAKAYKRSLNGIRQRWGTISRCVAKFMECHSLVTNRTGGTLEEDSAYDETVKLYLTTTNSKKWLFVECWELLRNNPKFNHIYEMRTTIPHPHAGVSTSNPISEIPIVYKVENESLHPTNLTPQPNSLADLDTYECYDDFNSMSETSIACNAENDVSFQGHKDLERRRVEALEMLAKEAKRKNELSVEHIRALNAATDAKYVTTDTSNLDTLSLQILELKKIKIFMDLQNVESKP